MTATLETELRSAIAHIEHAKDELAHGSITESREVIFRELGHAELSLMRVLHLIAGHNGNGAH